MERLEAGATPDLIVSANDAKYARVAGRDTYPRNAGADTLTVIDAASDPPRVIATVEVATTIAGPPQAVAISPDGRLAVVSAPNSYDHARQAVIYERCLQVIDLQADAPTVTARIDLGHHPQGLAINREGTLMLAATSGGTVAVLAIEDQRVALRDEIAVSSGRLAGVSFTHDGAAALVALREEGGLAVLDVAGGTASLTRERISTGLGPYAVDVSSDGRWAVVGNAGLAAITTQAVLSADADTVTLVDVSRRPFRAVQHLTVPSIPEGVALSPDGRWIAVQAMDGSNLAPGHPARQDTGRVVLFEIRDGRAHEVSSLPGGAAGQGVVFSADSRRLFVQFNVERQIAVYAIDAGVLRDTGQRISVSGGPASIRSMPR